MHLLSMHQIPPIIITLKLPLNEARECADRALSKNSGDKILLCLLPVLPVCVPAPTCLLT